MRRFLDFRILSVSLPALLFSTQLLAQNEIQVNFTYGSEKQAWIGVSANPNVPGVTALFNNRNFRTKSGKVIRINAIPMGSGDSVELTTQDNPELKTHITSPASSLYIEIGNTRYSERNNGRTLLQDQGNLVNSPVVIAMWEPSARLLGWPNKELGWADVMRAATADRNFRFGHTNPHRSNSGLAALVAQYYAGVQAVHNRRARVLVKQNVDDTSVQQFVGQVQSTMNLYGASTGFYATSMVEAGPQSLSAAVLYESDVISRNQFIREKNLNLPKLIAIYPQEGTFATNHPFALVNRDWVTDEHREAATIYFQFLRERAQQQVAVSMGFRAGIDEPFVTEQIFNQENGIVSDTSARILQVPKGDVLEAILQSWSRLKNRSKSIIIFDRSGSMSEGRGTCKSAQGENLSGRICAARDGAKEIVRNLNEQDQTMVLAFSSDVRASTRDMSWQSTSGWFNSNSLPIDQNLRYTPAAMTDQNKTRTFNLFDSITPGGGTDLYDTIVQAHRMLCQDMKANPKDSSIRAIFVLTDGMDSGRGQYRTDSSVQEVVGFAGRMSHNRIDCPIRIFSIAYESPAAVFPALKNISESTGGEAVAGDSSRIRAIFRRLGDFL